MKNIPKKIYIQIGEDCPKDIDFNDLEVEGGDEENVIVKFIKEWDGSTNSAMGDLLNMKFKELQKEGSAEHLMYLLKGVYKQGKRLDAGRWSSDIDAIENFAEETWQKFITENGLKAKEDTVQQIEKLRWVRVYDRVPTITKYYSIRNWITGQNGATVYCDNKDSILNYCHQNKFDYPEFEWLDETKSQSHLKLKWCKGL